MGSPQLKLYVLSVWLSVSEHHAWHQRFRPQLQRLDASKCKSLHSDDALKQLSAVLRGGFASHDHLICRMTGDDSFWRRMFNMNSSSPRVSCCGSWWNTMWTMGFGCFRRCLHLRHGRHRSSDVRNGTQSSALPATWRGTSAFVLGKSNRRLKGGFLPSEM